MDHSLTIANRTERIILNFAHRCALSCEWCYVPFGGAPAQVNMISAIVDRIAELGFRFLTIGGGDPFQYSFLPKILYQAKAASLFVHVDTHAKSMRQLPIIRKVLNEAVDLLGLPLDGSVAALHDEMRSAPGHFDIVNEDIAVMMHYWI